MTVRPVWHRLIPRNRYAAAIGCCFVLLLDLSLGHGLAQGASAVTTAAPVTAITPGVPAATAAALRERLAGADWLRVQVELRQPAVAAVPGDAAATATRLDELEQTAQDLLFALPAGSYDAVQRAAGASSLTLRVDAAGLDGLLGSPLVVGVAAVGNPAMQRIDAGWFHSLAVKSDGSLWAWGNNSSGQIGDGTTTDRWSPFRVMTGVAAVAAGGAHSLALKNDGSLWAWGSNAEGELGDGTTTSRTIPFQVMTGVAAVAAGARHTLAIKTDGSLWAWGYNWAGQLGDGTTTDRSSPLRVMTGVSAVAAGSLQSLAIKTDGSLWVWGLPPGDGTSIIRPNPIQVLTGVAAVAGGMNYTLALKTDGSVWAWGYNPFGELGDGTTTDSDSPIQVKNLSGVTTVATGSYHSLALKTDGTLWVWGFNSNGQFGDGTNTDRLTPVQVLTGVAAMAGGHAHTLALKTDGSLWASGRNWEGDLGDGTNTDRWSPVQVSGFGPTLPLPDILVTKVVLTPATPTANGTFSLAVTLKNQGTADSRSGPVAIWTDQSAARTPRQCGEWGQGGTGSMALAAGQSTTLVWRLAFSAAGTNTLRVFVDSTCEIAESNEANNQFTQDVTVLPLPLPDFVVTRLVPTPGSPTPNGTFSAAVTVQNQGTAAGTPGTLQVWANQAGAQACGAVGNKSTTLTSLAAGASRTVTFSGLSAGAAGAKTLRAFIDSRCQTAEADETNNQSTTAYTVTAPAPDFVVTNIVLRPTRPKANGVFSATVTVMNRGAVGGAGGWLDVWTDQPTAASCGTAGNLYAGIGPLAAGAGRTLTFTGLRAGAAGTKTLRAFVDSFCQTTESDEGNNQNVLGYSAIP